MISDKFYHWYYTLFDMSFQSNLAYPVKQRYTDGFLQERILALYIYSHIRKWYRCQDAFSNGADDVHYFGELKMSFVIMTSSNENIFRVTGPLWGEFDGDRWIPLTKASDAEFDVFFDLP